MNSEIKSLRDIQYKLECDLTHVKAKLFEAIRKCPHKWSLPKYAPIIIPGGYDPGDPPGTMGVDRRLPFSWPETRTPRWVRTCSECGLEQITSEVKETITKTPNFKD